MKSRFEQEISGEMGDFWQKHARKNLQDALTQAKAEAEIDEDGAIKWKCNGRYLMDDFCEMLEYGGYNFSREATQAKREAQSNEFLKEYRNYHQSREYSDEELYEMRAAFGEDAEIVDVITGESIDLSQKKKASTFERE